MRHATFRDTYDEARTLFRDTVTDAGAELFTFVLERATGPNGRDLSIDAARFGPSNATNILLCVSGTHGAEGFPGSAVQSHWAAVNGRAWAGSAGDTAVWMVHAVNPYGFAWQMRGNEDHIDLNRHWVDFDTDLPKNPEFDELAGLLRRFSDDPKDQADIAERLFALAADNGEAWVESVLTQGQYGHPDLMYFGGHQPAFSRQALTRLVTEQMSRARRVAYVDMHSGTIGIGELLFLCFSPPRSDAFARAASWWGHDNLDPDIVERKWGGRRPRRHGLMYWGLEELFGADVSFAGAVVEFGTVDPAERIRPLMAGLFEAWVRREGIAAVQNGDQHLAFLRWCFDRPGDTDWERTVLEKGAWVLSAALSGLQAWADEAH